MEIIVIHRLQINDPVYQKIEAVLKDIDDDKIHDYGNPSPKDVFIDMIADECDLIYTLDEDPLDVRDVECSYTECYIGNYYFEWNSIDQVAIENRVDNAIRAVYAMNARIPRPETVRQQLDKVIAESGIVGILMEDSSPQSKIWMANALYATKLNMVYLTRQTCVDRAGRQRSALIVHTDPIISTKLAMDALDALTELSEAADAL